MFDRMLIKLFAMPVLLLVGSLTAMWFLGNYIPDVFNQTPLFANVVKRSAHAAPYVGAALFIWAVMQGIGKALVLRAWLRGECDSCSRCGGIVDTRMGRYGIYDHCLACGKNRSI